MNRSRFAAFLAVVACALVAPVLFPVLAFAADQATGVRIDVGATLSPLVQIAGAALLSVATYAVTLLPAVLRAMLTEQLLKRAVDYAVATVAGAAAGKTVTIPVANEMIRVAAQYAADNSPRLTKALADTLGPKIIARLPDVVKLPDEASAADLDHDPKPAT